MQTYQREFLDLALQREALRFGDFTLKSGRVSPYFFNAGAFHRGSDLLALGRAYAAALLESGLQVDMLFGPAYKGIALASATAMALAASGGPDLPVAFNRKEAKNHGEGGVLIGAPLRGRVLIVDDVITAGTAIREAVALIRAQGATPAAVLIALDREERGKGRQSAAEEASRELGLPVVAIASLSTLLTFSASRPDLIQQRDRLQAYRAQYGTS